MSSPIAGWYPDPSGDQGKLRYWDGSSWTEHNASVQRAAAGGGDGQQAPGQQPHAQGQGGERSSSDAASSDQSTGEQLAAKDGAGSGRGAVIGIVIAAVVLAVVVVIAVVLLLSGDDEPVPRPAPTGALTQEPATRATTRDAPTGEPGGAVDGGVLELDATIAGAIAAGETWTARLTVAEATPVAVDVVAGSGDLTLTVSGDSVEVSNDDRGDFMKTGAVSSLDPALAVHLEPGEYEVAVSAYSGAADADFAVRTTVPDVVPAEGTIAVENGPDEGWLAAIELAEPATLAVEAVSAEVSDAVLGIFTSTGSNEGADHSDEGARSPADPYLELELPAGVHFISLGDYWGDPLTSELTITVR